MHHRPPVLQIDLNRLGPPPKVPPPRPPPLSLNDKLMVLQTLARRRAQSGLGNPGDDFAPGLPNPVATSPRGPTQQGRRRMARLPGLPAHGDRPPLAHPWDSQHRTIVHVDTSSLRQATFLPFRPSEPWWSSDRYTPPWSVFDDGQGSWSRTQDRPFIVNSRDVGQDASCLARAGTSSRVVEPVSNVAQRLRTFVSMEPPSRKVAFTSLGTWILFGLRFLVANIKRLSDTISTKVRRGS